MICKKCGAIIPNDDLFNHKCYNSEQKLNDNNYSVSNPLDAIFNDKKQVFNSSNDTVFENSGNLENYGISDESVKVDDAISNVNISNSLFDNNSSIIDNSSNNENDLVNNHLDDIFTQNKDDSDGEKPANITKSSSNDSIVPSSLGDRHDIDKLSSLNNKGNSLFITIFVIFTFVCSLGFIFLFRDRLFGTLKGENFNRSEDCRESIKNAYNKYVELYGKIKLNDGTCIIITSNSKKINLNIGDDEEKIVEYRDGKFYQDSIALDNYKLAISYNKDDMAALKKGNNNLINSFYFDSNEILK